MCVISLPQLCCIDWSCQDSIQFRATHKHLHNDHDALKMKYKILKRKHAELTKNGENIARKHEQDLKRIKERNSIQESSLRRDLQSMYTRVEIVESALSTKDEEIKELRDSRLLFKKKYHALKQKRSQDLKTPHDHETEGSLVILD